MNHLTELTICLTKLNHLESLSPRELVTHQKLLIHLELRNHLEMRYHPKVLDHRQEPSLPKWLFRVKVLE